MSRENYFLLLDLDCGVTDPAAITAAIAKKQAEWSRDRNNPKFGRQCQANLELIGDIKAAMLAPDMRAAEASQCVEIRKERQKKAAEEIDAAIGVLSVAGFVTEAQVADLARKSQGRFTEAQVRQRIKLPVRPAEEKPNRPPKPAIESSLFKEIADRLRIVGKADLYEFLDLRRNASLAALNAKAKAADADARKYNEKTAEVTAKQELAGNCLRYFKDDQERQKYDNTLDMQGLVELEPLIELAGAGGVIAAEVFDELIRKARERGIAPDEARDYISAFVSKRGWSVQVPRTSQAPELQRCACGVLNPETARSCGACGEPLKVACPRCNTINPSENRACSHCGFAVGDLGLARRLVRDADVALARDEVDRAVCLLKEAQVYWPEASEIASRLAGAELKRNAQAQAHRRALEALRNGRIFEAASWLAELPAESLTSERAAIAAKIAEARGCVERARALCRAGRPDDARDQYLEALRACPDFAEAEDSLRAILPLPPETASAQSRGGAVLVAWKASPSRGIDSYRVVRATGRAPANPTDGALVGTTSALQLDDVNIEPGAVYRYAVFAGRRDTISAIGAVTDSVSWIGELSDLKATVDRHRVSAQWRWPDGLRDALVVLRYDRLPTGPSDPSATHLPLARDGYDRADGFRHDLPPAHATVFFAIYPTVKDGSRWLYGPRLTCQLRDRTDEREWIKLGIQRAFRTQDRVALSTLREALSTNRDDEELAALEIKCRDMEQIEDLCRARMFIAASAKLQLFDPGELPALRRQIHDSLERSGALVREAENLRSDGDQDRALMKYTAALQMCADHHDAEIGRRAILLARRAVLSSVVEPAPTPARPHAPEGPNARNRRVNFAVCLLLVAVAATFLLAWTLGPRDHRAELTAIHDAALSGDRRGAQERLSKFVGDDRGRRSEALAYLVRVAENGARAAPASFAADERSSGPAAAIKALASAAVEFELAASLGFRDGEACLADCAIRQAMIYQQTGRSDRAIELARAAAGHYGRAADGYHHAGQRGFEEECRSKRESCLRFVERTRAAMSALSDAPESESRSSRR